jgi:hypothetical protein
MEEQGETSTVEHLFTTDELTIEIRKARPKVRTESWEVQIFVLGKKSRFMLYSMGPTKKKMRWSK